MPQRISTLRVIASLAVALTAVAAVRSSNVVAQASDVIDDPEAYKVYAAVLPIPFVSPEKAADHLALLQETRSRKACPSAETLPQEWGPVLESYTKENARMRSVLPDFDIGLRYVLVSLAEVKSLLVQAGNDGKALRGGWSAAYAGFPNGKVLAVSAVGFDDLRTRAMVVVQYNCGISRDSQSFEHDCHGGRSVLLQKQEERWTLAKGVDSCIWIA